MTEIQSLLLMKATLESANLHGVEAMLDELAGKTDDEGNPAFIIRYGTSKKYIQVVNFSRHQHPHMKEPKSEIPPIQQNTIQEPEKHDASTVQEPYEHSSGPAESPLPITESLNLKTDLSILVLDYLNEKTGSNYKAVEAHRRHIRARKSEGYSLDDFKTVIDKKCAEWMGTDQQKYLRPETLFGTKFDGYLNQTVKTRDRPIMSKSQESLVEYIKQQEELKRGQG